MQSLVFKVFSTMTGRGKTWELCVWFLYFQSSYLLASPSLGSGAEEEDVAHCINKHSSACLPMPARDMASTCHQPCHSLSLPKRWISDAFCTSTFTWTKRSPSLRNVLSKTGSFLHSQTPVFQQEQLPDFPLLRKPRGHPAAISRVCQTRGPSTDSPEQRLPWSSAPQGWALAAEEQLRLQHFSPWGCTGKGE